MIRLKEHSLLDQQGEVEMKKRKLGKSGLEVSGS